MSLYLLVNERGEYSDFDYENLYFYHSYEEAERMQQLLMCEQKLQNEIARASCKWVDQSEYIICEVPKGESLTSEELEHRLRKLHEKHGEELTQAREWRKKYEEDCAIKRRKQEQDLVNSRVKEIMEFKEWWDKGSHNDPFFEEKKSARCRGIWRTLEWHMNNGMDADMHAWYQKVRPVVCLYKS
jgi:hypothetical protein